MPSLFESVSLNNSSPTRIQFIDALRGVAALGVVLTHYNNRLNWSVLDYGNLGVPVFFVLSGFVIAMSIGAVPIDAGFLGRFALRRTLRLDPPYWATIALVTVVGYALAGTVKFDGVSVAQVLSHMFYLQDTLGFQPILPVFWTLCYEIQFYLSLVLLLWAMQRIGARPHFAIVATLMLSVIDRAHEITDAAFMGRFWFCFALGALAHGAYRKEISPWVAYGVPGAVLFYALIVMDPYAITSSATAIVISLALTRNRSDLLSGAGWQFMGRISYSLYLTHPLFGWLVLRGSERFVPTPLAVVIGVGAAIVSAWIFYVVVERPAIALSHRVPVHGGQRAYQPARVPVTSA